MEVTTLNAQTAVHWLLSSLSHLFPSHKAEQTLDLILAVINLASEPPSDESVNPLFDEDAPNEYAEEVELLSVACTALCSLLSAYQVELATQIGSLATFLRQQLQTAFVNTIPLPLWKRPANFLHYLKAVWVARAVLTVCPQLSELAASLEMAINRIPEIRHLPVTIGCAPSSSSMSV